MKCSFCSSNVPDGSELCPECGMILSLGDTKEEEVSIPGYTPNIFGSEPIKVPETVAEEPAQEIDISVPEYEPDKIVLTEDEAADSRENAVEEVAADEEISYEEPLEVQEDLPQEAEGQDSFAEEEEAESYAPPVYETESEAAYGNSDEYKDISSVSEEAESEYEAFVDDAGEQTVVDEAFTAYEEQDEEEVVTPVIVPVEAEEETVADEDEAYEQEEEIENVEDDDDDTYIRSGKKGTVPTIIALCLLLVCLVVAGGYIVKRVMPEKGVTTTDAGVEVVNTTKAPVIEPTDNNEETTDGEETTAAEETTEGEEVTTQAPETETTTEADTTEPSTEQSGTTKPTTTKPTTTRPTTTRPTTTKPKTTKPTTTKPSTTVDPYGINGNAKIQKPKSYLSSSYMGYTTKKVDMIGGPSSSSDWIQALGKGAEVKVLAKENGYSYIYSTRFGTYGWVKSSNISADRPVEETTSTGKNTVAPDKSGSGETMYTTYSLNLRKGPATSYGVIKTIPINYPVKVIGYKSGVSGWAYVTDLTSGINGWVATEYLK